MPPATNPAVMPRLQNFHPHTNTCHPERSEGSAFHQVRPQSCAKKITPWKPEGPGFIPAVRTAASAGALAPEATLNVGDGYCRPTAHPPLAVIQRSAFRDERSLFDCLRAQTQAIAAQSLA